MVARCTLEGYVDNKFIKLFEEAKEIKEILSVNVASDLDKYSDALKNAE